MSEHNHDKNYSLAHFIPQFVMLVIIDAPKQLSESIIVFKSMFSFGLSPRVEIVCVFETDPCLRKYTHGKMFEVLNKNIHRYNAL